MSARSTCCGCKVQWSEFNWNSPCTEHFQTIQTYGDTAIDASVSSERGTTLGSTQKRKSTDDQWDPVYRTWSGGTFDVAHNKKIRRSVLDGEDSPSLKIESYYQVGGTVPYPYAAYFRIFDNWEFLPTGDTWYYNGTLVPNGKLQMRFSFDFLAETLSHDWFSNPPDGVDTSEFDYFPNIIPAAMQGDVFFIPPQHIATNYDEVITRRQFAFSNFLSVAGTFLGSDGFENDGTGEGVVGSHWKGKENCTYLLYQGFRVCEFRKPFADYSEAISYANHDTTPETPYDGITNPDVGLDLSDGAEPIYFGFAVVNVALTCKVEGVPRTRSITSELFIDNLQTTLVIAKDS